MSCESSVHRLKDVDIPSLEKQILAQDDLLPSLTEVAEKVSHSTYLRLIYLTCMWQTNDKLQVLKRELKELASLRQHAVNVSRLHSDCKDLRNEISNVENSLAVTGSKKTADDVQQELDDLSAALSVPFIHACCCSTHDLCRRNTEKEKQNLQNERERRNNILRTHGDELHKLQLQETDLRSKVREKEALQRSVEAMRQEMSSLSSQLKVLM